MVQDLLAVPQQHWPDKVHGVVDTAVWPVSGTQLKTRPACTTLEMPPERLNLPARSAQSHA